MSLKNIGIASIINFWMFSFSSEYCELNEIPERWKDKWRCFLFLRMTFISCDITCSCHASILFDEESVGCPFIQDIRWGKDIHSDVMFAEDIWFVYIFHSFQLDARSTILL